MAEYGLQVKDIYGRVIVKITDRLTRFVGSFQTGITNGSFNIPNPGNGGVFFVVQPIASAPTYTNKPPEIGLSGNTITWTWVSTVPNAERTAVNILYGIY